MNDIDATAPKWTAVGTSDAVATTPVRVAVCGIDVVLFRRRDGSIAALRDRCPHYDLELSSGTVVGDDIECGYHGLRFDGTGRCTGMPTRNEAPDRYRVKAFAASESDGRIFVWTGSLETADTALLPR